MLAHSLRDVVSSDRSALQPLPAEGSANLKSGLRRTEWIGGSHVGHKLDPFVPHQRKKAAHAVFQHGVEPFGVAGFAAEGLARNGSLSQAFTHEVVEAAFLQEF